MTPKERQLKTIIVLHGYLRALNVIDQMAMDLDMGYAGRPINAVAEQVEELILEYENMVDG